jgi:hypothetical protein
VISGTTIGFRVWSSNGTTDEENEFGRRLVASFNSCKDIEVQALENGTVKELMGEIMAQNSRLESQNAQLLEALKGVIRVADRKTVEFDKAHAAIASAKTETP